MAEPSILNPHPPEYDAFLYASVGEDRNGYVVTVLSALARLGLDPWKETADLVTLGRDAAYARLDRLLTRFRDVPALAKDHSSVARDLSQLLPKVSAPGTLMRSASTAAESRLGKTGTIWAVFAILFALVQVFMAGWPGPGE